jgi:hypothetical protein
MHWRISCSCAGRKAGQWWLAGTVLSSDTAFAQSVPYFLSWLITTSSRYSAGQDCNSLNLRLYKYTTRFFVTYLGTLKVCRYQSMQTNRATKQLDILYPVKPYIPEYNYGGVHIKNTIFH